MMPATKRIRELKLHEVFYLHGIEIVVVYKTSEHILCINENYGATAFGAKSNKIVEIAGIIRKPRRKFNYERLLKKTAGVEYSGETAERKETLQNS